MRRFLLPTSLVLSLWGTSALARIPQPVQTWPVPQAVTMQQAGVTVAAASGDADGVINVRDYGAKGDGSADDTAAIQAAIDAAELTGGIVYIPPGIHKVSQLSIDVGITLQGSGSYFRAADYNYDFRKTSTLAYYGAGRENIIKCGADSTYGIRIKAITFTEYVDRMESSQVIIENGSNVYDVNGICLAPHTIRGIHHTLIEDCVFTNLHRGVYMDGHGTDDRNVEYTRINRCNFMFCLRGLEINTMGSAGTQVANSSFFAQRWGEYGIYVYRGILHLSGKCYFYGAHTNRVEGWRPYKGDIWVRWGYAHVEGAFSESVAGNFFTQEYQSTPQGPTALIDCYCATTDRDVTIMRYSDTGRGEIQADCTASHLFTTGARVTIWGSTRYNGTYTVTVVDADSFTFAAVWAGDDAAGTASDRRDILLGTAQGGWLTIVGGSFRQRVEAASEKCRITAVGTFFDKGILDVNRDCWQVFGGLLNHEGQIDRFNAIFDDSGPTR